MRILGNTEYINDYNYRMEVSIDIYVPDTHLWITPPTYLFIKNMGEYEEVVSVLASPKNSSHAWDVANGHNAIYNSELMKALREG